MSVLPENTSVAAGSPDPRELTPGRGPSLKALRLRGLLATIATTNLALTLLWGAIQSIFLAVQVQTLAPDNAAGGLALVIGVGALGAMVGAPIAGMVSDRTRSRIGGRGPWMLFGAGAAVVLAMLLAFAAPTIELIALYWFLMQIVTNFIATPLSAHIPARVPVQRRGLFSSLMGISQLGGNVVGQSVGAAFLGAIGVGYIVVSAGLIVGTVTFVLVNRQSNLDEPKAPFSAGDFFRTFWVNPVKFPNFAWTFFGRFLIFVGYFPLSAYTLYILQSYIGLGEDAAASVAVIGLASLLGTVVGTPIAGFLVDKIGRVKPLVFCSAVILIISFAIPMVWPTVTGMIVYSFIAGLGLGSFLSVDYVLITQVLPSKEQAGKDLGIINITSTLPQTIGVAVAGLVVTVFGGYFALFPVAIVFVLVGGFLIFLVRGVR